jgi:hypothetical protein
LCHKNGSIYGKRRICVESIFKLHVAILVLLLQSVLRRVLKRVDIKPSTTVSRSQGRWDISARYG